MWRAVLSKYFPPRLAVFPATAVALLFCVTTAGANIGVEAAVYINVRPAGPVEERCQTDIIDCCDIHSSTPEEGLLEFQIFIDPMPWLHGPQGIAEYFAAFRWPEAWTFVDCTICPNGEYQGQFTIPCGSWQGCLGLVWMCPIPEHLFFAATLVFDVRGYGQLEPLYNDLCLCPFGWVAAASMPAEAGTGCEYSDQPCRAGRWLWCDARFDAPEMVLTGFENGTSHGEMGFIAYGAPFCGPGLSANCEMPWMAAHIEPGEDSDHFGLFVDADLTGLPAGQYESEVQVDWSSTCGSVARCLPVTVIVESASAVEETVSESPGSAILDLRLASANPSPGPFRLAYENPAAEYLRCAVYDVTGREIARLLDGRRSGGSGMIAWDAVDAGGERVRTGVYLVRLEAAGSVRSCPVVVVR